MKPVPPSTEKQAVDTAACEASLPTLRELARTYQAVMAYSDRHVRELGLTPPQFDAIATLGNTAGMNMRQLAEKTLVTKGTLTGIVDRLESKGLARREVPPGNRRCFTVVLTPEGQKLFERVFPPHVALMKERFSRLPPEELEQLRSLLSKLRTCF